jgi:hypothetical protein
MRPLATFVEIPPVVVASCSAGIALLLIGAFAAKNEIAEARGLDKIVALSNLCFAIPLAEWWGQVLVRVRPEPDDSDLYRGGRPRRILSRVNHASRRGKQDEDDQARSSTLVRSACCRIPAQARDRRSPAWRNFTTA